MTRPSSRNRAPRLALVAAALLAAGGCFIQRSTDNVTLHPSQTADIEVGKTTIGEAFAILGSPTKSIKLLDHEAFVFEHHVEKRMGIFALLVIVDRSDAASDSVTLIVDRRGIVCAVGSRFDANEAKFGLPWQE